MMYLRELQIKDIMSKKNQKIKFISKKLVRQQKSNNRRVGDSIFENLKLTLKIR